MSKDPAFLFYPGDYLRDTQNLSPATQVAYDRIMCEHMRKICVTQQQLKFFTKRLNKDEKEELSMLLAKKDGVYIIDWVAESIIKRREYSESRRSNRIKKDNNISKRHDSHKEDEDEIENKDINKNKSDNGIENKKGENEKLRKQFIEIYFNWFREKFDLEPTFDGSDSKAMKSIIEFIRKNVRKGRGGGDKFLLSSWKLVLDKHSSWDKFYQKKRRIREISSNLSNIITDLKNETGAYTTSDGFKADKEFFRNLFKDS